MTRWCLALTGLFLSTFAVVVLLGPGRIDIVDGQTRYEVARSLVEHGDSVIRDPRVWFAVFPGREGRLYCNYRLPHSLAGFAAILAADATGPHAKPAATSSSVSLAALRLMAITYAVFFRHLGLTPRWALFWAAAGVFCTPSWYYGTNSFDDILGSAAVVLAVCLALATRRRHPCQGPSSPAWRSVWRSTCKQPLGVFVLPVLAAIHDPAWLATAVRPITHDRRPVADRSRGRPRIRTIKVPPGSSAAHALFFGSMFQRGRVIR